MKSNTSRVLVSFSCGAASAVAAKMAVDKYCDRVEVIYCDTLAYEHTDNMRFLNDVSKWIGKAITILRSTKYTDIFDVYRKTGWLVGHAGARCTTELKRNVIKGYQRPDDIHVVGLTCDELDRIDRFEDNNTIEVDWILRDRGVSKADCYRILSEAGISLPAMYLLGYNNNNCIGCVKGQQGYWNKIRVDFPESFARMARFEREIGVAINKTYAGGKGRTPLYLDQLDPTAGRGVPLPNISCGAICETPTDEGHDPISIYSDVFKRGGDTHDEEDEATA